MEESSIYRNPTKTACSSSIYILPSWSSSPFKLHIKDSNRLFKHQGRGIGSTQCYSRKSSKDQITLQNNLCCFCSLENNPKIFK